MSGPRAMARGRRAEARCPRSEACAWRITMHRDRTALGPALAATLLILSVSAPATVAQSNHGAIVPFTIAVPEAVLTDLKERLTRTRWPGEIEGSGWEYGTNLAYLRELV